MDTDEHMTKNFGNLALEARIAAARRSRSRLASGGSDTAPNGLAARAHTSDLMGTSSSRTLTGNANRSMFGCRRPTYGGRANLLLELLLWLVVEDRLSRAIGLASRLAFTPFVLA